VSELESAKVNRAIQRGLARCRRSNSPVVVLAQFLDELRADQAWHEATIRTVETAIRHILARIVSVESPSTGRSEDAPAD
jgi:hypothetical protein